MMKKQKKITDYFPQIPKGQQLITQFFKRSRSPGPVKRSRARSRSPVKRSRARSRSPLRSRSRSPLRSRPGPVKRSRARSRSLLRSRSKSPLRECSMSPVISSKPVGKTSPRYWDINVNPCTVCKVDMGPSNPRQLCGKWYCRNNE